MATAIQKITSLGVRREIPFNKLVLSQANVRRVKQGVSIDTLAESIARRGLLQNLNVWPVLDEAGAETGMFKVPAGRRFRALEQLVRAKRLTKTFPIPRNVRDADSPISEEEDRLSENTDREDLDPIDQYRAFRTLVDERGLGIEEVAAIYAVTPAVVRQRLRLAAVSEALIDLYATDELTLEQLMAFSVSLDHARQEQVWSMVAKSPYREPYQIRRMLIEGAVRASDRRALFVGIKAYEEAGGTVLRDLVQHDDGGWLQDPAVLDRLAIDKLQAEAQPVADEGWGGSRSRPTSPTATRTVCAGCVRSARSSPTSDSAGRPADRPDLGYSIASQSLQSSAEDGPAQGFCAGEGDERAVRPAIAS